MNLNTRCITFDAWCNMSETDKKTLMRAKREGRLKIIDVSKDLTMLFFDILPPKRKESSETNR